MKKWDFSEEAMRHYEAAKEDISKLFAAERILRLRGVEDSCKRAR